MGNQGVVQAPLFHFIPKFVFLGSGNAKHHGGSLGHEGFHQGPGAGKTSGNPTTVRDPRFGSPGKEGRKAGCRQSLERGSSGE